MFIWFCPKHGHTYGFHLINKAKGCKDPFCSLFKFLEHMPKHIFYDFACSLSEYALNRAPKLFRFTRFWHDLFHAIDHKCGMNVKSGRIDGLEGINTEICEQVNSYLQCIKFTGSHLSQEHFMFFTIFLIFVEQGQNKEVQPDESSSCSISVVKYLYKCILFKVY